MKRLARKGASGDSTWSYDEIVKSFDNEIVVEAYRGDLMFLLKDKKGNFGYLVLGWGSFSWCDAAMACETVEDATKLRDELYSSIVWMGNDLEVAQERILYKDWEGTFLDRKLVKNFIEQVVKL